MTNRHMIFMLQNISEPMESLVHNASQQSTETVFHEDKFVALVLFNMWNTFLDHLCFTSGTLSSPRMSYVDCVDDVILVSFIVKEKVMGFLFSKPPVTRYPGALLMIGLIMLVTYQSIIIRRHDTACSLTPIYLCRLFE